MKPQQLGETADKKPHHAIVSKNHRRRPTAPGKLQFHFATTTAPALSNTVAPLDVMNIQFEVGDGNWELLLEMRYT
ncbi:hypothetical protein L2E82_05638 [Cichorium intybus]|uniref:Uncharacterized protein n=1 Tax=Cichorium intybus TaxID=13427 RepID=A0ACB9H7Q3_CICIN|nr:hypothetical protein L2E82_05638 [Cichorium intybus]